MSIESDKTYEVGYKKPPVATRFKKGKSPFPSGRPKKAPALREPGAILEAIDNEEIAVTAKGKRKWMKKAEIQHRLLFTRAIKGDLSTARLLLDMAIEYFAPSTFGSYEERVIGPVEAEELFGRNYKERIRQHNALVVGE